MTARTQIEAWLAANFPAWTKAGTPAGTSGSCGTRSRHVRVYDPPPVVGDQPTDSPQADR